MSYQEIIEIITKLINNSLLLLALVLLYSTTNFHLQNNKLRKKIVAGLLLGITILFVMMNPWELETGVFFDARNVLLGISGVFFGFIPTTIAAVFGLAFRIYKGGAGVLTGCLTIINSALVGLFWYQIKKFLPKMSKLVEYYVLGVLINLVTLLGFFTLDNGFSIIVRLLLPYLVIFPILFTIIAIVMKNQAERLDQNIIIKEDRRLLQAAADSTQTMEIFALNKHYEYLIFNSFHKKQMNQFYKVEIAHGDKYLDLIKDTKMRERIEINLNRAIKGEAFISVIEIETSPGKYVEEQYTPILNDLKEVTGVTIFSSEVTDRKKYESSILYLSYNDALTGLYNSNR